MTEPADHASPMRQLMAQSHDVPYSSFASLDEAQADHDGAVIFEGDYGGQIYLTVPARLVRCNEATLADLLSDIDEAAWNDSEGTRLVYERCAVGEGVSGGMGGGMIVEGVWTHGELAARHADICAVVYAERDYLP